MAVISPVVQQNVPIVDPKTGFASSEFTIWMTNAFEAITTQVNINSSAIAAIQANQASIIALQAQLVAVQQAQNPASGKFGSASALVSSSSSTWVNGPVVNLTGVTAGNLTYPGSGPNQVSATTVNDSSGAEGTFIGNWRIVEIVGAVETVVFTGTYTAQRLRDDGAAPFVSIVYNNSDTSGSIARTSTGAVSYRADLNAPGFEAGAVQLNLYCNRA